MARGWESKAVEAQIEESTSNNLSYKVNNAPPAQEVQSQMQKANLLLSRKRIVQQLEASSSDRYSELLRRTLADLDGQLGNA